MQIGVNSEYITRIELFSDRNDVRTLQPLQKKILSPVHKAATYGYGESVPNSRTDSWFPMRGTAAKTAMVALAVPSAAGPKIQPSPKRSY